MSQYKYYLRKPKSEIVKDALGWLAVAGAVYIAAGSPYFSYSLMKKIRKSNKYPKKKVYDTFYRLRKQGCINIGRQNHKICISLTAKGKKLAGRFQIDSLEIKKPRKWDGKWRIVIFDIAQLKKLQRNVFRANLSQLGLRPLQKSVWLHPYNCRDEVELLRDFFGMSRKEVRFIVADNIEDDILFRKIFKL